MINNKMNRLKTDFTRNAISRAISPGGKRKDHIFYCLHQVTNGGYTMHGETHVCNDCIQTFYWSKNIVIYS